MVSVHKYGFFLCRKGSARILLGSSIYLLSRNYLCIYTPNTFFQILDRTTDLEGILEEAEVSTYYPAVSAVDIRHRLQIRRAPCVVVSEAQAEDILRLYDSICSGEAADETSKGVQEKRKAIRPPRRLSAHSAPTAHAICAMPSA